MTKLWDWKAFPGAILRLLGLVKPKPVATLGTFGNAGIELSPLPFCATFAPLTHFGVVTGDDICDLCGLPASRHPVRTGEYWRGYSDGQIDTAAHWQGLKK